MAEIHELIDRVAEPELKARLLAAVDKLSKQKKFGLVFEDHLPECTPLYEVPVQKGRLVSLKGGETNDLYVVLTITDGIAACLPKNGGEVAKFPVNELVSVAEFGEPIYPYLKPIDTVCNAPDSSLWHTLIEADNYHALQLLEYLYAGQVDCIYIDPPYNTGAKDWKYNNDYVDGSDTYRHSKWLSMMQKRLKLAKRLLNPENSVLIVTIDEKEYLHLGCLLEEIFPQERIQMVNIIINKNGVSRNSEFKRAEEYAFFIMFGESAPDEMETAIYSPFIDEEIGGLGNSSEEEVRWERLLRGGSNSLRTDRPNLFYPIYIDETTRTIRKLGQPIPLSADWHNVIELQGLRTLWPLRPDGTEATWRMQPSSLKEKIEKGLVRIGAYDKKNDRYTILYLADVQEERIRKKDIVITGHRLDGSVIVEYAKTKKSIPTTVWGGSLFSASEHGSKIITKIFGDKRFSFPKSFYATKLTMAPFIINNPNALVVDFFAGSGTTLHAVNLLNAEDGGYRRCILVTNNEVSADEAKTLTAQGFQPGDEEWERLGIARYVTWPRTVCSIEGHDINGQPLKGNYLGSDIPMSEGFQANAAYFKLGFLDKTSVALGQQFQQMLPTLWMKAGAKGPCPQLEVGDVPPMLILPENGFAILSEEAAFEEFAERVNEKPEIETVYLITDYEAGYRAMSKGLNAPRTFQLYRDYLDNFRINTRRDVR